MSVTFEVSQFPISWLKAKARQNIEFIFVTFETFHPLMSWLIIFAFTNIINKLVTLEGICVGTTVNVEHPLNAPGKPETPGSPQLDVLLVATSVSLSAPVHEEELFPKWVTVPVTVITAVWGPGPEYV